MSKSWLFGAVLVWGLWGVLWQDIPKSSPSKRDPVTLTAEAQERVVRIMSRAGLSPLSQIQWAKIAQWDILSTREGILSYLGRSENRALYRMIMDTSWYKEFILGSMDIEVFLSYFNGAKKIQETLDEYPDILPKIENTPWWASLRKWTPPQHIIDGDLAVMVALSKINREFPDMYTQVINHHPKMRPDAQWNIPLAVDQLDVFDGIRATLGYLESNSHVINKMRMYWYNISDIYKTWKEEWVYILLSQIRIIEGWGANIPEDFLNSPIGIKYRNNEITPQEALEYIGKNMQ